jgi:hypothetical protein
MKNADIVMMLAYLIGIIIVWSYGIYWFRKSNRTEEQARELYLILLVGLSPLAIGVTIFAFAVCVVYPIGVTIPNLLIKKKS